MSSAIITTRYNTLCSDAIVPKGRHKHCNNNKDGDEKTLHAMGLTRYS